MLHNLFYTFYTAASYFFNDRFSQENEKNHLNHCEIQIFSAAPDCIPYPKTQSYRSANHAPTCGFLLITYLRYLYLR